MSDSKACIKGTNDLLDLVSTLESSKGKLKEVISAVDEYLKLIEEVFKAQLEACRKRVEYQQERVRIAEERLESCLNKRHWDEEKQEYVPSCHYEETAVKSMQDELRVYEKKYNDVQSLVDDCRRCILQYKEHGWAFSISGAEGILDNVVNDIIPKAIDKLKNIISIVEQYQSFKFSLRNDGVCNNVMASANTALSSTAKIPGFSSEKAKQFRLATERLCEKNVLEDKHRNDFIDTQMREICPNCHRPKFICICPRTLERER